MPSRHERTQIVIGTPEEGIDTILTREVFTGYLRPTARSNEYSFSNSLLTAIQRPDATGVAGYQRWKALGGRVKKGEMRIKILGPYQRRIVNLGVVKELLAVSGRAHAEEKPDPHGANPQLIA